MIETELKLTAHSQTQLEQVIPSDFIQQYRQSAPYGDEFTDKSLHALYYDTAQRDLRSRSFSLRSRKEGDEFVLTLKFKGELIDGLSVRKEIEEPCSGFISSVSDLPEGEIKQHILSVLTVETPLLPRVEVKMQRTAHYLEIDGTVIELVSDSGTIKGPSGRQVELYEIELELKKGEIKPMIELGKKLETKFNLTPSTMTKHAIGLSLS